MQNLTIFYESPYCDIYFNSEFNTVQTVWKGIYVDSGKFRIILNKIIDALTHSKSNVIVADARQMQMIWKEDREWIISEWYPNAMKAGFRCQALIVTDDSYNELALKQIVEKYDDVIVETGYFLSFASAQRWVKEKMSLITTSNRNPVRDK